MRYLPILMTDLSDSLSSSTPNVDNLLKSRVLEDFLPQNWSAALFEELCSDSGKKRYATIIILFNLTREVVAGRVDANRPYKTTKEELGEALDYFKLEIALEELRRRSEFDLDSPTVENFLTNRSGTFSYKD